VASREDRCVGIAAAHYPRTVPRYEPGFENRCGRCGAEPVTADFYLRVRALEPIMPDPDDRELTPLCDACFRDWQRWFNREAQFGPS
jgi:hypothetical protein